MVFSSSYMHRPAVLQLHNAVNGGIAGLTGASVAMESGVIRTRPWASLTMCSSPRIHLKSQLYARNCSSSRYVLGLEVHLRLSRHRLRLFAKVTSQLLGNPDRSNLSLSDRHASGVRACIRLPLADEVERWAADEAIHHSSASMLEHLANDSKSPFTAIDILPETVAAP
jgi:hypothetical protein